MGGGSGIIFKGSVRGGVHNGDGFRHWTGTVSVNDHNGVVRCQKEIFVGGECPHGARFCMDGGSGVTVKRVDRCVP